MYDILIKNATILTLDNEMKVFKEGCIGINDDSISYIGNSHTDKRSQIVIDAKNNIVMPGLINAHTHSAMSIFRGMADDIQLFEWLNEHIWPVENKFVNAKNVSLASELSIAEMITSGTTTFSDMYFYSPSTAEVVKRTGIRAVLGEAIINKPNEIYKISEDYYKEFCIEFSNDELITPSFVPHSPYTCTTQILKKISELSVSNNILKHIHISETADEVAIIKDEYGKTPIGYLNDIGFLDKRTAAVHCVELTDDDINILSEKKVSIVHCPQSNLKLGSGIASIKDLLKAGVTIALGTDGASSNNTLDMFSEMKTAGIIHKGYNRDATLLNAKEVVRMATINGAEVLGIANITGSIEKGKKADLIMIDMNSLHLTPVYDPYCLFCKRIRCGYSDSKR